MKKIIVGITIFTLVFISYYIYSINNSNNSKATFNRISLPSESTMPKINIVAHRGAMGYSPENSLPAFDIAGEMGFWGAECDTMCTKDGVWVLMHDVKVDRTTNGKGRVQDLTLEQLKKLRIDSGNNIDLYENLKIPTLEEYLQLCNRHNMIPIIEVKESPKNDYNRFIYILKKFNLDDKCIVISFSMKELLNISKLDKEMKFELLIDHPINSYDINNAKKIGNCYINTKVPTIEGVRLAHENGIFVNCYLINTIERAKAVMKMGVDEITTDWINVVN